MNITVQLILHCIKPPCSVTSSIRTLYIVYCTLYMCENYKNVIIEGFSDKEFKTDLLSCFTNNYFTVFIIFNNSKLFSYREQALKATNNRGIPDALEW